LREDKKRTTLRTQAWSVLEDRRGGKVRRFGAGKKKEGNAWRQKKNSKSGKRFLGIRHLERTTLSTEGSSPWNVGHIRSREKTVPSDVGRKKKNVEEETESGDLIAKKATEGGFCSIEK